ncbi:MAG: NAD-dependent epimerase/dehydratase family protein, partial [Oscillospiraceae bacterium]|jgi:nucleoside-diphosphate-sugar epimerase|nr:NAD-dependent epimerase/dehydratase family protein [Oscillospiraceae bacterium]
VQVTALCRENDPNQARLPPQVAVVHHMKDLEKADVFYHLAWESASGPGRADAVVQTRNAELTLEALLTADRLGCKRFIAMGTIYERLAPQILASGKFGGPDFYILSKTHAHTMADQLAHKLGIEFVWCTICHPIGRYIKPDQMMASVVASLLSGISPSLGFAQTVYDIVAVEDVARGLRLLGDTYALRYREYYIGSGSPKPLYQWLEDTRCILGVNTPLGIGELGDDGLEFDESWFQISPLAEETGYAPQISFERAVANIIK